MNVDFKNIENNFGNQIHVKGFDYDYFGGTAYLGIPQDKDFLDLYVSGLKKFGLNNGTSRSNNIQLAVYSEAEAYAASYFHADHALITSSGYLAAQLTVKELSKLGEVVYAPSTHPALWHGNLLIEPVSFSDWASSTVSSINSSEITNWVIISNSMNNLFPEIYNFDFIRKVSSGKNIILIVDDSHGIGINNDGRGAYNKLAELSNVENVVVASMAKALGVDAGVVIGSNKIISLLKKSNEFAGASPPSAAGLFAFMHAKEIYVNQWQKLQHNINLFTSEMENDVKFAPGFPAFLIEDENIETQLLKKQILISSFPYPTADSSPINRIVLSSWHEEAQIKRLSKNIQVL